MIVFLFVVFGFGSRRVFLSMSSIISFLFVLKKYLIKLKQWLKIKAS